MEGKECMCVHERGKGAEAEISRDKQANRDIVSEKESDKQNERHTNGQTGS